MGRADKLIAESVRHGLTFPDDHDRLSEENGFLRGAVRGLCEELARYSNESIKVSPGCFLAEVEDRDGATFTAEYEYFPLIPGRIYGPPENCYPDEGGSVEIGALYLYGDKYSPATFDSRLIERWQDQLYEQHAENERAEYEYQREEENERRRGDF